jgi:hypothetical protein
VPTSYNRVVGIAFLHQKKKKKEKKKRKRHGLVENPFLMTKCIIASRQTVNQFGFAIDLSVSLKFFI